MKILAIIFIFFISAEVLAFPSNRSRQEIQAKKDIPIAVPTDDRRSRSPDVIYADINGLEGDYFTGYKDATAAPKYKIDIPLLVLTILISPFFCYAVYGYTCIKLRERRNRLAGKISIFDKRYPKLGLFEVEERTSNLVLVKVKKPLRTCYLPILSCPKKTTEPGESEKKEQENPLIYSEDSVLMFADDWNNIKNEDWVKTYP